MLTFKQRKAQDRVRYMGAVEEAVVAIEPRLAGKLNWDGARHFYEMGLRVEQTAANLVREFNEEQAA